MLVGRELELGLEDEMMLREMWKFEQMFEQMLEQMLVQILE